VQASETDTGKATTGSESQSLRCARTSIKQALNNPML
jgi:hypothetical protein